MTRDRDKSLHKQVLRLRWVAPLAVLLLAAFHQTIVHLLLERSPRAWSNLLELAAYSVTGSVVVWLGLTWLGRAIARHEQAQAELQAAQQHEQWIYRQLHTVHDIGRRVATADNMQHVLELAAHAPVRLSGAKGSTVVSFDETHDRLKLDMAWGLSEDYVRLLRQRMEAGVPAGRCQNCEHLTARVSSDCPLFVGMKDLARAEGIQSLICLPITGDRKREGIISAYFPSPDGPPEEQVQLLNIVATEIALALDGVRFRANQMATIYALDKPEQDEQDLIGLLEQILDTTLTGWGAPEGAILLYDEDDGIWHCGAQRGLGAGVDHPRFELALHLAQETRQSRQPLLIPDLGQYLEGSAVQIGGVGSAAAAPLVAGGEPLGALVMVAGHSHLFKPRQAPLFQAITHQAALTIRNAQLHTQVQRMAVLEERYRLSREMHDGLAQTLGALGWQLDHLQTLLARGRLTDLEQELAFGRQMVRDAYVDVREAIDGLRLVVDHPAGLAAALQEYAADFQARTGIETLVEVRAEGLSLPAETELQLLRIVQEALINVRKHAAANHVQVRLLYRPDNGRLTLVIADEGRGFDPALPRGRGHLGLATMRERAQSVGGEFTVVTGPGQGTRLTVTLPAGEV